MESLNPTLLSDARIAAAYAIFLGSSGIGYRQFLASLAPVALAGLLINWGLVHWIYLRGAIDRVPVRTALSASEFAHSSIRKKPIVVVLGVLAGFLAGVPAAMAAAVGAAALLITRTIEPRRVYEAVDWGLLVFFVGLFIIVGGVERAGLTTSLLEPMTAWNLHRLPIFVLATTVLSNIVSNVPAVMVLRTLVADFPDPHGGWLTLAMASTLAGNLTITGSVANIIVVERAAAEGVTIGFGDYFRVGLPLTAVTLTIGSCWLAWIR